MLFHQLKTLIWRNLVLKKRRPFSTLLEIIIPTIIVIIIGNKIFINFNNDNININFNINYSFIIFQVNILNIIIMKKNIKY